MQILFISWETCEFGDSEDKFGTLIDSEVRKFYLLTNWLAYLYGRIQSPRPDFMPDRREGITSSAGFGYRYPSQLVRSLLPD